ncbi:MAG: TolC family outer membrane protein [bacterium]|nr:TolC family outer membrane protein [bacterium]
MSCLLSGFMVAGLLVASALAANAESLSQALQRTLATNPTINAEREKLRAVDEGLDIAGAGYRPTISLNGDVTRQNSSTDYTASSDTDDTFTSRGYSVTFSQPLYRGGRTVAAVSEAEANSLAAREALRNVEQNVLLDVATTYVTVVRDTAIKDLRKNDLRLLDKQLRATRGRHDAGVVTSTDVALALSRKSAAQSELTLADANLRTARAEYMRLTGRGATKLFYPAVRGKRTAGNLMAAINIGKNENPGILAAFYAKDAAQFAIDQVRGERLPQLSLEAGFDSHWDVSKSVEQQRTANIKLSGTMPLYQGGAVMARIRRARATYRQKTLEVSAAQASTHSQIVSNWGGMAASKARINSAHAQIAAAQKALLGITNEEKVGQRTVLDVLDAEQELLEAKVALQQVRGDYINAYFRLLSAMGRLHGSNGAY